VHQLEQSERFSFSTRYNLSSSCFKRYSEYEADIVCVSAYANGWIKIARSSRVENGSVNDSGRPGIPQKLDSLAWLAFCGRTCIACTEALPLSISTYSRKSASLSPALREKNGDPFERNGSPKRADKESADPVLKAVSSAFRKRLTRTITAIVFPPERVRETETGAPSRQTKTA
jgi:hypothetical protein